MLCEVCGTDLSHEIKICAHCGNPVSQQKWDQNVVLVMAAFLLLFLSQLLQIPDKQPAKLRRLARKP